VSWQLSKKLTSVEVGDLIDVRDTDYIWCVGQVRMVVESQFKEPVVTIHYLGWNMYYDEFLPLSSPRLAKKGFYTDRKDIPHYKIRGEEDTR